MARSQKNVSMDEEYQEKLENLAQSLYSSKKKQGQVIEHLIDMHGNEDLLGMVEDIHAAVVDGQTTHTQDVVGDDESDDGGDNVLSELKRKAEEGEAIDPAEYDLEAIKGKPVDRAGIVARAVLTGTHIDLDKNSIQEFCQREVGYSTNAARDLAKEVMWELEDELYNPVPSKDWVSEQVEEDLRNDRHNARQGGIGMSEPKYRREFGGSVEAYAGMKNDLPRDGPYSSEQEAADAVYDAFDELLRAHKTGGKHQSRHARRVMCEVWERTSDEVRETKPASFDITLDALSVQHDVLSEVLYSSSD